jgi:hypothetical protein
MLMDKPLHGGPVSPWPRRARRFARGCGTLLLTGLLSLVVLVLAIAAMAQLGTLVVGLALAVLAVVVWALVGIRPLTVALAIALLFVLFVAVGERFPFGLDRAVAAVVQTVGHLMGSLEG